MRAVRAHRRDQRRGARHDADARAGLVEHASGRSLQQRRRARSSAATKSISPFIARRVISATCARMPRKSASSSSISFSMMVDSMIGDEQALAPSARRLAPRDRSRRAAERGARRASAWLGGDVVERHVAGDPAASHRRASTPRAEPSPAPPRGVARRRRVGAAAIERQHEFRHARLIGRGPPKARRRRARKRRHAEAPVVIVAGPTASGKSALALALAEEFGGTIINADSMQVYRDLRVLTARPGRPSEARAPHRLYGVIDAAEACSVGRWRALALAEIAAARAAGRLPILAGGTGLYLQALLARARRRCRRSRRAAREAARALHARARRRGVSRPRSPRSIPTAAARLAPGDTQRLMRAYEVVRATGRPLARLAARGAPAPRRAVPPRSSCCRRAPRSTPPATRASRR